MGGLVSPNVSARCCFSIQVATQRGLSEYGLAQPCKGAWRCQADNVTPEVGFEEQAHKEVCAEPGCLAGVTAAMRGNWKTAKAAQYMLKLCDAGVISVENGTKDGLIRATAEGLPTRRRRRLLRANQTANSSKPSNPMCFPGEALVQVQGRGVVPIASLRPGEWVLAATPEVGAPLVYEPVLDWIHIAKGSEASYTTIRHEHGILRASAGHLIFAATASNKGHPADVPAGLLQKGDTILAMPTNSTRGLIPSMVLSIQHGSISLGMYAPLTRTGTIVVDGILASNYATPSLEVRLPHWLAHVGLLPVRLFHALGLASVFAAARTSLLGNYELEGGETEVVDLMHPYFSFLYHGLHVHKLLQSV